MNAIIFQWVFTAMVSLLHPYYISMTEIEQDKSNNTLEISVRIFTDDLEKTIRKNYTGKVDLLNKNEKTNSEKLIQEYILKHFSLKVNGTPVSLHFDGFESEEGSIWSYFECQDVSSLRTLDVSDTILHDYTDQQINFIHVKVPGYDETVKLDYPDSYKQFKLK
jgi:hypothetical protein